MARRTPEEIQATKDEYKRVRRNLLRQYRGMLEEGLQFDKNPIPKIPQKIDAGSIRKLEKIKSSLLDKAWIEDKVTGERLTGRQYRNVKRWKKKDKPKPPPPPPIWDVVIDAYMAELDDWEQNNNTRVVKNAKRVEKWVSDLLGEWSEEEKKAVAEMIEEGAQRGCVLTWEILYDDGLTQEYMTEMERFFPGKTGEERDAMRKERAEDEEESDAFDEEELLFY